MGKKVYWGWYISHDKKQGSHGGFGLTLDDDMTWDDIYEAIANVLDQIDEKMYENNLVDLTHWEFHIKRDKYTEMMLNEKDKIKSA